jgi:hypothetical protein
VITLAHINKLRLGQPWVKCWLTPSRGSTYVKAQLSPEPPAELDPRGIYRNPFGRHVYYACGFNGVLLTFFKAN